MKKLIAFVVIAVGSITSPLSSAEIKNIGLVSIRTCLEQSKVGKAEQESFEGLKKQLEQSIEQKEKELNELAPKFTDEYLDTLTPEAERELKEKFKMLSQDLSMQQNQYFAALNQANAQSMQKLIELVNEASKTVAKTKSLQLVMNDEICFFKDASFDVTAEIIKELDLLFDAQKK